MGLRASGTNQLPPQEMQEWAVMRTYDQPKRGAVNKLNNLRKAYECISVPSLPISNLNLPSRHLKQLVLVNPLAVSSSAQPANLRAQRGAPKTTSTQPAGFG